MAAVPGTPAAGSSPACPSSCSSPAQSPGSSGWGNLILQEKHKMRFHQNLCCPLLCDQEAASKSSFSPSFTIFHLKISAKVFSPLFTNACLAGISSDRQHQCVPTPTAGRQTGVWLGGRPPCPLHWWWDGSHVSPHPFCCSSSSSTKWHQAMPLSVRLAVLQGGDGNPPSTPSVHRIPLPPPSHLDGHRGAVHLLRPSAVPAGVSSTV